MKTKLRLLSIVALGLLLPLASHAAGLPVTYSSTVLPQSFSVPPVQGDIFLTRAGDQNDVQQKILLRGVPGGVARFDATGKLTADAIPFIVKTAAYTAVANDRIAANTTSAAFPITLPPSPVAGNMVTILDAAATFDTNNLTLTTTDKIDSSDSDLVLSGENAYVNLVYINSTIGWKSYYTASATGSTAITGTLSVSGLTTLTGGAATGAKIYPSSNDGAPLGDTTHNFSDLFLASGAIINYANSDVVLTHTSGILTLGTGDLRITTAGTNAASVVTVGGTQTLTNKTLTAPVLGVATATSLNGLTVTTSTGTLTVPNGVVLTGPAASGTAATLAGSETLTNKTLTAPVATAAVISSAVTNYTADGAITLTSGVHTIAKTSAAAMTVAAPSSQNGTRMTIISNTDFAHVITFTGATLLDGTTGANLTVTMTAFKGSAITVIAVGSIWLLESSSNVTSITP